MPPDEPTSSRSLPTAVRTAAEHVLAYLAEVDSAPPSPVDAVIGFGVFDLTLPVFCAELFSRGLARQILFTGGIGAGTGNLGGAEADVWRQEVRRTHPHLPEHAFILENRSTNTSENIQFTAELLKTRHPALGFGSGIRSAIIVASPSRLRRVRLTMQKLQPAVQVVRMLPNVEFAAEHALYASHGVDYLSHLIGELDRLANYPARGWIAPEALPSDICDAGNVLRLNRAG
jgi:uncharacterized SAM-binding protein YcdF (DUF218 family)